MPTSFHGYQRILIKGVPVWKKNETLFLYDTDVDTNPIEVGTVSGGFKADWLSGCSTKLSKYRGDIASRVRATPAKKK
jgi:hypothetical protein